MAYAKNLGVLSSNRVVLSGSNVQVTGSLFGTQISGTTITANLYQANIGSAAAVSYGFGSFGNDTGMYRATTNQLGFATNGAEALRLVNQTSGAQLQMSSIGGVAGAPTLTWNGDNNTGIFRDIADQIGFSTNSVERMRITNTQTQITGNLNITGSLNVTQNITSSADLLISDGNLVIGTSGKGISFANTTPDGTSVSSEILDDYEEGTWTPGLGGSTSDGSYTYGAGNVATYTKIGDVVYISCQLDATVTTALTGNVHLTGLPFTQSSLERKRNYGIVGEYSGLTTSVANFVWEGIPSQTYVRFNYTTAAATSMTTNLAGTNINRTAGQTISMRLVGFYYT